LASFSPKKEEEEEEAKLIEFKLEKKTQKLPKKPNFFCQKDHKICPKKNPLEATIIKH
jgi:hypothetical protein